MRALVVDDSRAIRTILGRFLKDAGFDIFEAGHGREALARLGESGPVELVMVDWNMPEMNGLELVMALRADERYRDMRIIMVTTESELGHIQRALAAGANEYIMKPFDKDGLRDKLLAAGVLD